MNKVKRILTLVIAFALVLTTFGTVIPASADQARQGLNVFPADVLGTDYEEAVGRLVAFGLVEGFPDGTYKPERGVNRAEFAKLIIHALGLEDGAMAVQGQATGFSDVKSDHWAAGYINIASAQGLIKGYPDGSFRPEEKVSHDHSLTMLVRSLGYQDEVLPGTWPVNYRVKAIEVGITKGLNLSAQTSQSL